MRRQQARGKYNSFRINQCCHATQNGYVYTLLIARLSSAKMGCVLYGDDPNQTKIAVVFFL